MRDFIYGCDVPISIRSRILETDDYELYIADCFWVFVIDGFYEFYYNPELFMGKIRNEDIPYIVKERILQRCVNAKTLPDAEDRLGCLKKSSMRMSYLEKNLRIGNWFYAQGQHYVTYRNRFIADDMYVPDCERDCPLQDINRSIVDDMLRMAVQTRTPHYIRNVFELDVFQGINPATIEVLPFSEKNWSAQEWKKEFEHYTHYRDYTIIKKLRAEVFQDTLLRVKRSEYISESGNYIKMKSDNQMIDDTQFYGSEIPEISGAAKHETVIEVRNQDTLYAAKMLIDEGLTPAVLNMASRRNPGGGVYGGAGAQEENLFRRTNLFRSLFQFASFASQYGLKKSHHQYPLDRNWGGVYTPKACIFRGSEADGYPLLDQPYYTDFVAVPAINNPELDSNGNMLPNMIDATKRKMRTIFRMAYINGNDSLVLGAFGCGAFKNPPKQIARIFREVLEEKEFCGVFRKIIFAILDDHNAHKSHNPEGNLKPFEEEFSTWHK